MSISAMKYGSACSPAPATGISRSTSSGYWAPHSSVCIAPIEGPVTHFRRLTPRWSISARWTRTKSRMVTIGKVEPYGRPVSGSIVAGPTVVTIGSLGLTFDIVSALTTK